MKEDSVWQSLGSPIHVASPMVDASEFAFRSLVRKYDAHLCYTPMLHGKMFLNDATYRKQKFDCGENETSLVAQFAGDDPSLLLEAARIVESRVSVVDLNCGCPQPIARKGHYGAALLRESDLICSIIRNWSSNLTCGVSCKIRILDEGGSDTSLRGLQATINLAQSIEAAGADFITVHGRTRLMSGKNTGCADWDAIAAIKNKLNIPVIANGNIERHSDIRHCLQSTGCDAVMSAESLLENPALFSGQRITSFQLASEYLQLAQLYPPYDFHKCTKAHILRMLSGPMNHLERQGVVDVRSHFAACKTVDELQLCVDGLEKDVNCYCRVHNKRLLSGSSLTSAERYIQYKQGVSLTIGTSDFPGRVNGDLDAALVEENDECVGCLFNTEPTEPETSSSDNTTTTEDVTDPWSIEDYLDFCQSQCSWYRRHRIGVIDIDRESRKETQRIWIDQGLRFNR